MSLSTCEKCGGHIPLGPDATNCCEKCGEHVMGTPPRNPMTAACPRCADGVITMESPWLDGRRICSACFTKATSGVYIPNRGQKVQPMDFDIGRAGVQTITYTMTPSRFMLEIPVAALANLSTDAHTRMLEMLNAWILRHKPLVVKEVKP